MKWRDFSKNQRGFSLVELMVVVSIAGGLIAVAVPQFCRYSSLTKQAQAKSILGAIWVAEQSFSIQAGSYTACLTDIGVTQQVASPVDYYGFGFNPGYITSTVCGPAPSNQSCSLTDFSGAGATCLLSHTAYQAAANMDPINPVKPSGLNLNPFHVTQPGTSVSNNTFFAMAVGNISSCNSAYDRWTIDQNKNISNDTTSL